MTVATAAVAVLPGIKMSCEEMGALSERLTCRTTGNDIKHTDGMKHDAVFLKATLTLTLRYICPCPPAVPLSSTDWLIVDVAEAPIGRLLVVDPDPDVTMAYRMITRLY